MPGIHHISESVDILHRNSQMQEAACGGFMPIIRRNAKTHRFVCVDNLQNIVFES